ncbi:Cysteine-rich with EGF-like domain protein 2-A [Orchesella cincta]|uniref:Cysteine-rich with EGF-like domain protein 2-A n=1 Tax=Orchesella cincta TaxID=48709 RepID=A0A1D2N5N0_ORCCI|nr:Cysteine-rich with EGF-like domain protein 2-A [Orchesella cincta]
MRLLTSSLSFQVILIHFLVNFIKSSNASLPGGSFANGSQKPSRRLAPCQACRTLVNSFHLGLERTAKGHYGGGDTAWEEENKKVYKNSELRLVEIQEGLCNEISQGKDQCHELATENEHLLEEWWNTQRNEGVGEELMPWLCVNKLQVCCPEFHYGPQCLPCLGHPEPVCSGHGKCKGSGTRKGNGECSCETGYTGKLCDSCAQNFYEAYKDTDKLLCSACHKACQGGCSGAGCAVCKDGWEADDEKGCIDLNECLLEQEPCKQNEFCVNTEGSYTCIECDKSCDGCYGDGPDMCEKCASGYFLKDKLCIEGELGDEKEEKGDEKGENVDEKEERVEL